MQKKGLGRGLSALIPDVAVTEKLSTNFQVEVDRITSSSLQPRRAFDEIKLEELASSVRDKGILQPLLVRRRGEGYELIAGERRWRAALKAGLEQVPVIVKEATDNEVLQLALIENLQREDLNPIEEASAYQRLQGEFHWSQEEIAEKVGKSRPTIANSIRLLLLPKEVQQQVAQGELPAGQARALLGLQTEPLILAAAREAIAKGLSTRETEKLVRRLKSVRRRKKEAWVTDPNLRSVTEELQRALGTKVRLVQQGKSARGKIEIEYYSFDDLERIIERIAAHQTIS